MIPVKDLRPAVRNGWDAGLSAIWGKPPLHCGRIPPVKTGGHEERRSGGAQDIGKENGRAVPCGAPSAAENARMERPSFFCHESDKKHRFPPLTGAFLSCYIENSKGVRKLHRFQMEVKAWRC